MSPKYKNKRKTKKSKTMTNFKNFFKLYMYEK